MGQARMVHKEKKDGTRFDPKRVEIPDLVRRAHAETNDMKEFVSTRYLPGAYASAAEAKQQFGVDLMAVDYLKKEETQAEPGLSQMSELTALPSTQESGRAGEPSGSQPSRSQRKRFRPQRSSKARRQVSETLSISLLMRAHP